MFKQIFEDKKIRITKNHQVGQQIQQEVSLCLDQFLLVFWRAKYVVQVYESHNVPILWIAEYLDFSILLSWGVYFWVFFSWYLWGEWHVDIHNIGLHTFLSTRFRLDNAAFIFKSINYYKLTLIQSKLYVIKCRKFLVR